MIQLFSTCDASDGIPNVLSDADTYMIAEKSTVRMTKQRRSKIKFIMPEENRERYEQNKKIIDMSQIPIEYKNKIIEEYLKEKPKKEGNIFKYCLKYNLGQIMKLIN